jgi:hypothetical protein
MRNMDSVPRTPVAVSITGRRHTIAESGHAGNNDASILIFAGLGLLALAAMVYALAVMSGIDGETFKLLTLYP